MALFKMQCSRQNLHCILQVRLCRMKQKLLQNDCQNDGASRHFDGEIAKGGGNAHQIGAGRLLHFCNFSRRPMQSGGGGGALLPPKRGGRPLRKEMRPEKFVRSDGKMSADLAKTAAHVCRAASPGAGLRTLKKTAGCGKCAELRSRFEDRTIHRACCPENRISAANH